MIITLSIAAADEFSPASTMQFVRRSGGVRVSAAATTTTLKGGSALAFDSIADKRYLSSDVPSDSITYNVTVQTSSECTPNDTVQGKVVALVQNADTGEPAEDAGVTFVLASHLSGTEYAGYGITNQAGEASYSFGIDSLDEGTVLGCSLYVDDLDLTGDVTIVECLLRVVKCS
jgi:hypothetical protein